MSEYVAAYSQLICKWIVDHALYVDQTVVADPALDKTLELLHRLIGHNIDYPRRGVTSKKCPLGTFEYLNAGHIGKGNRGGSPRHIGVVVERGNRGVATGTDIGAFNAANGYTNLGGTTGIDFNTGHKVCNVLNVLCAGVYHILGGKGVHCDRYGHMALFTFLGRDDDFLELHIEAFGFCVLGKCTVRERGNYQYSN